MRASLNQAIKMAKRLGYVFLATADAAGSPHVNIVQLTGIDDRDRMELMSWFCEDAFENLRTNPRVAVIIWDPAKDTGYQLLGKMEDMREVAELDGYAPGLEEKKHFPQIEWKILVRVKKVLNFQKAPHVDAEV